MNGNGSHNDSFGGDDEITDPLELHIKDRTIKSLPRILCPHA